MIKLAFLTAMTFILFKGSVKAQEPISLNWNDTETKEYEIGYQNLKLYCVLNQTMQYLLEHRVDIYWRHPLEEDKEVRLFHTATREEAADPEFYDLSYASVNDDIIFTLTIKNVRVTDDGFFVCKSGTTESIVDIVVLEELKKTTLQIDDLPPISQNPEDVLILEPGVHRITCTAQGSNPEPKDVSLLIAESAIEGSDIVYQSMQTVDRQYSASINASVIIGYTPHDGKMFTCQGVGPSDIKKSVSVKVRVNTPPANITCKKTKAYLGQENVVLTCNVLHKGVKVDIIKYTIGGPEGKMMISDSKTFDGRKIKVQLKSLDGDSTIVQLIFSEVTQKAFDSFINLVVESAGGYLDEEKVELIKIENDKKKEQPGNGVSSMLNASFITVFIACISAFCVLRNK